MGIELTESSRVDEPFVEEDCGVGEEDPASRWGSDVLVELRGK